MVFLAGNTRLDLDCYHYSAAKARIALRAHHTSAIKVYPLDWIKYENNNIHLNQAPKYKKHQNKQLLARRECASLRHLAVSAGLSWQLPRQQLHLHLQPHRSMLHGCPLRPRCRSRLPIVKGTIRRRFGTHQHL